MKKINLKQKLSLFTEKWTPKIIAEANGQFIKIAKVSGDFVWHKHEHEDEVFIVLKGQLILQFKEKEITLEEGEMYVIPKGIEHCPRSTVNTHILLIEPKSTRHTGDTMNEKTIAINNQEKI